MSSRLTVSFEFFPPATPAGAANLETSAHDLARFDPAFASVTYGAGGSNRDRTFSAIDRLTTTSLNVAGHLTCVASSRAAIDTVIDTYHSKGVRHVVALRGDPPEAELPDCPGGVHPEGFETAADLVAGIRERHDRSVMEISVGAYPEVHPKAASPEADLDNLKRKIDAGADRALTQFFFEPDVFLRFVDRAQAAGITAPIVPGIMPIVNFGGMTRFADRCGTTVPDTLRQRFDGLDDSPDVRHDVSVEVATAQCQRLIEHGADHLHFYTMNKPKLTAAVLQNLGIEPAPSTTNRQVSV